ncbi:MAG: hypothetical protein EBZ74_06865 [Planctomycetia bacterium]|nr:hypothetical protein [Planctomycetia bacterium]
MHRACQKSRDDQSQKCKEHGAHKPQQKTLDLKLARIAADPRCREFILADAKDADMAFGPAASAARSRPRPHPHGRRLRRPGSGIDRTKSIAVLCCRQAPWRSTYAALPPHVR